MAGQRDHRARRVRVSVPPSPGTSAPPAGPGTGHREMTARFPARLHVLLARQSRAAVVVRRGPSKYACTIGWDRSTDTFAVGQWLHGRIYERRSDLSPDGKFMIYFAMNGKWSSEAGAAWTAISIAPYLKALRLWAKGSCWHGGGLFTRERSCWLNGGADDPDSRSANS